MERQDAGETGGGAEVVDARIEGPPCQLWCGTHVHVVLQRHEVCVAVVGVKLGQLSHFVVGVESGRPFLDWFGVGPSDGRAYKRSQRGRRRVSCGL